MCRVGSAIKSFAVERCAGGVLTVELLASAARRAA